MLYTPLYVVGLTEPGWRGLRLWKREEGEESGEHHRWARVLVVPHSFPGCSDPKQSLHQPFQPWILAFPGLLHLHKLHCDRCQLFTSKPNPPGTAQATTGQPRMTNPHPLQRSVASLRLVPSSAPRGWRPRRGGSLARPPPSSQTAVQAPLWAQLATHLRPSSTPDATPASCHSLSKLVSS